jgi:hypothetical protein
MNNQQLYNSPAFRRDLYNRHDTPAKQKAKGFFKQFGFVPLPDDKEHYSKFDFQMEKDNQTHSVEVEIKCCWYGESFPFRTMDVAGRKANSTADWFVQFNCNYTALAVCPMKHVQNAEKYRKDTKYSTDEIFFAVELNQLNLYKHDGKQWVLQNYNKPTQIFSFKN